MVLRFLTGLLLLLALLWAAAYIAGIAVLRGTRQEPWPFALGSINDVQARHQVINSSREAYELMRHASHMETDSTAGNYLGVQTAKKNDTIDPLPANIADADEGAAQFERILLDRGDRLQWGGDVFETKLADAANIVAALALRSARNGDGGAAWEHLHAIWILSRSLSGGRCWGGREMALRIARQVNAVARKLPPPVPPWLAEMGAVEPRRETGAALQEEAYTYFVRREYEGIYFVLEPLRCFKSAAGLRHLRRTAEAMASSGRCRVNTAALRALRTEVHDTGIIDRAARIEAELEATAKVLALKTERARLGRWPAALPDATSRCAGNQWIYEVKPDGSSMKLRMKNLPALEFVY